MKQLFAGLLSILELMNLVRRHRLLSLLAQKTFFELYHRVMEIILSEVPEKPLKIRHEPVNLESMQQRLRSEGITCSERFIHYFSLL